jgi:hypothetical protein
MDIPGPEAAHNPRGGHEGEGYDVPVHGEHHPDISQVEGKQ